MLLTFEVHHGAATEAEASTLRTEIEKQLKELSWDKKSIHTTYTSYWSTDRSDDVIKMAFSNAVNKAYTATKLTKRLSVGVVFFTGTSPVEHTVILPPAAKA